VNWNNVNGNGMTLIGNKLGLFLDYGRSPHVHARARVGAFLYRIRPTENIKIPATILYVKKSKSVKGDRLQAVIHLDP